MGLQRVGYTVAIKHAYAHTSQDRAVVRLKCSEVT